MATYTVTIEVEVKAANFEQAARFALDEISLPAMLPVDIYCKDSGESKTVIVEK